jgi:hypothetical protein
MALRCPPCALWNRSGISRDSDLFKNFIRPEFVAARNTGPDIGAQLSISAKTVDTYKQRIEENNRARASSRLRDVRGAARGAGGRRYQHHVGQCPTRVVREIWV